LKQHGALSHIDHDKADSKLIFGELLSHFRNKWHIRNGLNLEAKETGLYRGAITTYFA